MATPVIVTLSPLLLGVRERWLKAGREEQETLYAQEFAPHFIPLFKELPLYGWSGERPRPRFLAAVLGLSWQPVALMTAWFSPTRLLLLGTPASGGHRVNGEPVVDLICRLSGLPLEKIEVREIREPEELGIYREVNRFVTYHGIRPRDLAIDPTGGKKSMSVSAALAGYLTGSWLVYVDYLEYCPQRRIPLPGSEYPRLLHNPLEVFGENEFHRIRTVLNQGVFEEARNMAEQLADRLYDFRQADIWVRLARTFGAWHRFEFKNAAQEMEQLTDKLRHFGPLAPWPWAQDFLRLLAPRQEVLKKLEHLANQAQQNQKPQSLEEGLPLVLNHLAAAERALTYHQYSLTILLTYATLERFVDLCLWAKFGLDDENPDFSQVTVNEKDFHAKGRKFHGPNYRPQPLAGPLSLSLGVQLLATLCPDLMPQRFFGPIKGMMTLRNRSEYEHGLCPQSPAPEEAKKYVGLVKEILAMALGLNLVQLEDSLESYRFPNFLENCKIGF